MRLLVVEDETRIVELLRSAFERAGFVVDAVGTTTQGDQVLSLVAYDAVILDLGLPTATGCACLSRSAVPEIECPC
jgi:two-component system response regulator QseB